MSDQFKEKIQSMSGKEIILNAIVDALQNPVMTIKMTTNGDSYEGICYGCGTPNFISKIMGKTFTPDAIDTVVKRAIFLETDLDFLRNFEYGMNCLTEGRIHSYNVYATKAGFATINPNGTKLPYLQKRYTPEQLQCYADLAHMQ